MQKVQYISTRASSCENESIALCQLLHAINLLFSPHKSQKLDSFKLPSGTSEIKKVWGERVEVSGPQSVTGLEIIEPHILGIKHKATWRLPQQKLTV